MKAFECKMCGHCCFGEGGIRLQPEEIDRIARFLGITRTVFLKEYCEERNGRIYIRTGPDGYCIFYDHEKKCTIHPVNPAPCNHWPFYDALLRDKENWETAKEACPGINPDCPFEEFVKQGERWRSRRPGREIFPPEKKD